MNESLLSKVEMEKISVLLPKIIEIKQEICEVVKCPLNKEDVCTALELKEFDFENHEWVDME